MSENTAKKVNMELKHVEQYFPQGSGLFHALEDVDLKINTGDFICLVGFSRCGARVAPQRCPILHSGKAVTS